MMEIFIELSYLNILSSVVEFVICFDNVGMWYGCGLEVLCDLLFDLLCGFF